MSIAPTNPSRSAVSRPIPHKVHDLSRQVIESIGNGIAKWDYLILTASNERQATAYREQLELRERLGLLAGVERVLVVPDPQSRRVGSGGSTVACLAEVVQQEAIGGFHSAEAWLDILQRLRILIIHAGGDSRRLPAYGPCGKVFLPLPGWSDCALASTLFDRQLPTYLKLPSLETGRGQVIITAGDVLLDFSPEEVAFADQGFTGLAHMARPEQAQNHGVYCTDRHKQVLRVLQKPTPELQAREKAINRYGEVMLDIGIIGFDCQTAVQLMELAGLENGDGDRPYGGLVGDEIMEHGLDFYREVCCALGKNTSLEDYLRTVRTGGSRWSEAVLQKVFYKVSSTPMKAQAIRRCDFLHFGTTREIITSGQLLGRHETGPESGGGILHVNSRVSGPCESNGSGVWLEGCRAERPPAFGGNNILVGVDMEDSIHLPEGACLDVLAGQNRKGNAVNFVRPYRIADLFNGGHDTASLLGGWTIDRWLTAARGTADDVWDAQLPEAERSAWNARLFPSETSRNGFMRWLWMLSPSTAATADFLAWRKADRYSLEEMAELTDQRAFHVRRARIRSEEVGSHLKSYFRAESGFSADDLKYVLAHSEEPAMLVAEVLQEARLRREEKRAASVSGNAEFASGGSCSSPSSEAFLDCRVLHTLGTAVSKWIECPRGTVAEAIPGLPQALRPELADWLGKRGMQPLDDTEIDSWCNRLRESAFEQMRDTIVNKGSSSTEATISPLRPDEIVWGRIPARLDLAGGWTDTPPYSLEYGGAVLNAAVHVNGQPPIQAYARLDKQRRIRLHSIDRGTELDIHTWDELLDYASATGEFSLAKGALALAGLRQVADAGSTPTLEETLDRLGGGLELTTLAAIPKGSGLGTSSIMGTVLLAVVHRVLGTQLSTTDLFHSVLRLEQAMTTGGGWQDQIGGAVGGLKLVTTRPGLIPCPTIRYLPADVLDPRRNGGSTILYYTGITRLAKNILGEVVGRYLDRNRRTVATLRQIHNLALEMTEAMARKDLPEFGRLIDCSWRLNNQLDPNSSTEEIEVILKRVRQHTYGAKLLGAGGGGFLLMVCKSPDDVREVRRVLESDPPNRLARFFEYSVSSDGLALSVC